MARRTYPTLPLSEGALERLERAGRRVAGDVSHDALVAAVSELSRLYTRERSRLAELPATDVALQARLRFFFVRDLPKIFGPLDELARRGALLGKRSLRLLDVGAGLGATTFGVARWLRLHAPEVERLEVVALEQNPRALRTLTAVASQLSELPDEFVPVSLETRTTDVSQLSVHERYDLVSFGFVLNELFTTCAEQERTTRRAELLIASAQALRERGAVLVLEPAARESARELMAVRDVLAARHAPPFVVAPCLHAQPCPMLPSERDWCHQELVYALPERTTQIARAASLRYEGLSYASLVLTNEPGTASAQGGQRLRVVSDRLESKGKVELFGCGEAGYVRLSQLTRKAKAGSPLLEAKRGDVLTIAGALAPSGRVDEQTKITRE